MKRAKRNEARKSLVRVENGVSAPLSRPEAGVVRKFVEEVLARPRGVLLSEVAAEELIRTQPDLCRQGVELLRAGYSPQAVSQQTGIEVGIVRTLAEFVPNYADILKNATLRNLRMGSLRMAELLAQQTDALPKQGLAFALSVTCEKGELLSGGVTVRTESRPVAAMREELRRLFDSLPRAKAKMIEVQEEERPG